MKFKTEEELKLKQNKKPTIMNNKFIEIYNNGIEDAFKSFAERVEFYKKYKDNPFELKNDDYELWIIMGNENREYIHFNFKDWLFDYCFGDVIQ